MEKVKIDDIENLIRLADDVLKQIEVVTHEYDAEGICLWNKVDKTRADYYEQVRELKREDSHRKRVHETKLLLSELLQEEKTLSEIYDEPAEVLIQKLEPIKSLILGVFRNGAEQNTVTNETNYYADNTISDDYLMELFAMRLRDKRIMLTVQRFPKTYFLLVRGYENCHDGDEFLGIYESLKKLRVAYKNEKERMESKRDEYGSLQLMIYEFNEDEYGKSDIQGKTVIPEELWGEKVVEYEKVLLNDDLDNQFEAYEEELRKALDKAILLAVRYHAGQRDLQGENYIMHPLRLMLNAHDATTKMVSVLHDILEDTACTEDILRQEGIPETVVEDVKRLTRRKDEEYFSYISRVNQNYFCKVIKQKDIEDNLREGCPSSVEKRYRKALEILKERGPYHFHKLVKGDIDLAYSHPKEDGSIYVYCEQADRKYTFKTAMIRKNDLEVISRYGFTDEEMQEILEEIGMEE